MSAMNQIREILDKLANDIGTYFDQKQMMTIGSYASDLIRIRTRLGYGVPYNGAPREKLLELGDYSKAVRKQARDVGDLSEFTTPNKSNLTFTGQLLSSVQAYNSQKQKITVGPKGYRKDGLSNEFVGNSVSKFGRPFNNLSDLELKKLNNFVEDGFTSAILRRMK